MKVKKQTLSLVFSALMLLLFGYMAIEATNFQSLAKYFPLTIAIFAILVCLIDLLLQLKRRSKTTDVSSTTSLKVLIYIGWIVGYLVLIFFLGFIVGTAVFLFAFLYIETGFKIVKAAVTMGITIAVIFLFGRVIGLYWPSGMFF
ncbi:tripartite tricarboxylate transporter TctB family protein [Alkalihalobacillus oceani]|uniref:Tripartite tricarboxylate transporter TctB family protein n=1 Tax=Halalkalibacter oceani TaxID=1653776 RepID=A0A9X2DNJ0_9BACI|nr:tripartite tricarboxylate transporter TctB family protein [Halalkalibacter oceani]MCM3714191.1 tripartite tricarboxylate transporter TctB family protein [Halalkalibacter oceani]